MSTESEVELSVLKVTRIPITGAPPLSLLNCHSSRTDVGPMSWTLILSGAAGAVREGGEREKR